MMYNTKWIERGSLAILAVVIGCEIQEDNRDDERMKTAAVPDDVVHELDAIAAEARTRLAQQKPTVEEIEAVLRGENDAAALFGMTDKEYAALGQRLIDATSGIDPAAVPPAPPRISPEEGAKLLHAMTDTVWQPRRVTCRWIAYGLCLATYGMAAAATGNVPLYVVGSALCACTHCTIPC